MWSHVMAMTSQPGYVQKGYLKYKVHKLPQKLQNVLKYFDLANQLNETVNDEDNQANNKHEILSLKIITKKGEEDVVENK